MEPCPHTNWIAESRTDGAGMVTEHCANPLCNATRKVYGSWEALQSANLVDSRSPHWRVFPRIDHDSIDDIMREIKAGGGMVLNGAISSQPDPIGDEKESKTPELAVPAVIPFSLGAGQTIEKAKEQMIKPDPPAPPTLETRKGKKRKQSKVKHPYGYMIKNEDSILRDIILLGAEAARDVWKVPESTWKSYIDGKWKDKLSELRRKMPLHDDNRTDKQSADGLIHIKDCPCAEMSELRGYRQAVQDLVKIAGNIQKEIRDILKEVVNGNGTGKDSNPRRNSRKLRKSPVKQG